MEQKKTVIGKIGSFYNFTNKIWIFIALIGIGLAFVTYNNDGKGEVKGVLGCSQTPASQLKSLPDEQLKTIFSISKIDITKDAVSYNANKNYIPVISEPKFTDFTQLNSCITDDEMVVAIQSGESVKVYPARILYSNLLVNDKIGDTDIVITYCGFCDSFQVFERKFNDESLSFGISNYLYKNSDMLFDRKSESLWSQMNGEALAGTFTGGKLKRFPFRVMNYKEAKTAFPAAQVLSFDTGSRRDYTTNQFANFTTSNEIPSPIFNTSDKLNDKQQVIGFFFNNKPYVFTPDLMPESVQLEGKELQIAKTGSEYIVTSRAEKLQVSQAYWYVWYDFYPETTIISKGS